VVTDNYVLAEDSKDLISF